jgi:predicted amidohydrolase
MRPIKIASIQLGVVENDKQTAIQKAAAALLRCKGADLVILPEIWNIGFMSFEVYLKQAENRSGPTLSAIRETARQIRAHVHAGSFVEKDGDRYYNSSYLISPEGDLLGNYRKIHLFGYNSKETELLTPGDAVTVVETPLGKLGLATCFDLRFPELFRRMVCLGSEVFLICSAWPFTRLEPWLMFNRVRALENQSFLISANAAGINSGVQFAGHSMIIGPWGDTVAVGGNAETILRGEIDLDQVRAAREEFPALASRVRWLDSLDG